MKAIAVILLALAVSCTYRFAAAQEVGRGLVCDTAEQAEEIALAKDRTAALRKVNEKEAVCAVAVVFFTRGEDKKILIVGRDAVSVTEITVEGAIENGVPQRYAPTVQYTLFLKGEAL